MYIYRVNCEPTSFFNLLKKNLTTERFLTVLKKPSRTLPKEYFINNSRYPLQNTEIFLGLLKWKITKFLNPVS